MKPRFALLILSVMLSASVPSAAFADASSKPQMTVNGKVFSLTNARAIVVPSPRSGDYVRVVISDQPISSEEIKAFPDILLRKINAGQLNALSFLVLDNHTVDSLDIYSSAFGDGWSPTLSSGNVLEIQQQDSSRISGRLHIESPHKFAEDGAIFSYDVNFDATIQPND
jgi:hypothetical protein